MDQMSARGNPRKYFRLTKADRHAIEKALDKIGSQSCRSIADELGSYADIRQTTLLSSFDLH